MTNFEKHNSSDTSRREVSAHPPATTPSTDVEGSVNPTLRFERKIEALAEAWAIRKAAAIAGGSPEERRGIDQNFRAELKEAVTGSSDPNALLIAYRIAEESVSEITQQELSTREGSLVATWKAFAHDVHEAALVQTLDSGRADSQPSARADSWEEFEDGPIQALIQKTLTSVSGTPGEEFREQTAEAILTLRTAAEREAEKTYLEADTRSTALKSAIDGQSIDYEEIIKTLEPLSDEGRFATFKVYQDKYGIDFQEELSAATENGRGKFLSFLRSKAIVQALSDRFGIGPGILTAAGFMLRRGWRREGGSLGEVFELIKGNVTGPEKDRLDAMLKDDRIRAKSDELYIALFDRPLLPISLPGLSLFRRDSFGLALKAVQDLKEGEREEVKADFMLRWAEKFPKRGALKLGVESVQEAIESSLSKKQAGVIVAQLDGNPELAAARMLRFGAKEPAYFFGLLTQLNSASADFVSNVFKAYEEETGKPISKKNLPPKVKGPAADWFLALAEGDIEFAKAARLQCALRGRSEESAEAVVFGAEHSSLTQMLSSYEQHYGKSFLDAYKKRKGKDLAAAMETYIETGTLDRASQARDCLAGPPDPEGLKALSAFRSPEEQGQLVREYGAKYDRLASPFEFLSNIREGQALASAVRHPRDLYEDVASKLHGYQQFDTLQKISGESSDPKQLYREFLERYAFEHHDRPYMSAEDRKQFLSDENQRNPIKRLARCFYDGRDLPEGEKNPLGNAVSISLKFIWRPFTPSGISESSSGVIRFAKRAVRLFASPVILPAKVISYLANNTGVHYTQKRKDCDAVGEFYTKKVAPALAAGETVSRDDIKQLRLLIRLAGQSMDKVRELKEAKANTIANIAEAAVFTPVATASLTFLGVPWVTIGVAGTALILSGRFILRQAYEGNGNSVNKVIIDGVVAAANGWSLGFAKYARGLTLVRAFSFARRFGATLAKMAVKTGLKTLNKTVLTPSLLSQGQAGYARLLGEEAQGAFAEDYARKFMNSQRGAFYAQQRNRLGLSDVFGQLHEDLKLDS